MVNCYTWVRQPVERLNQLALCWVVLLHRKEDSTWKIIPHENKGFVCLNAVGVFVRLAQHYILYLNGLMKEYLSLLFKLFRVLGGEIMNGCTTRTFLF